MFHADRLFGTILQTTPKVPKRKKNLKNSMRACRIHDKLCYQQKKLKKKIQNSNTKIPWRNLAKLTEMEHPKPL